MQKWTCGMLESLGKDKLCFHLVRSNVLTHGSVDLGYAGVCGHAIQYAYARKSRVVGQREFVLRTDQCSYAPGVRGHAIKNVFSHGKVHLRYARALRQGKVCVLTQKWTWGVLESLATTPASLWQRLQHTFRSTFHWARSNVLTHGGVGLGYAGVRGHAIHYAYSQRSRVAGLRFFFTHGQSGPGACWSARACYRIFLRMEKCTSGMLGRLGKEECADLHKSGPEVCWSLWAMKSGPKGMLESLPKTPAAYL